MRKGARWYFAAVLCSLALVLLGCRPGEGTPTVMVTASPTLTAETQPEAAAAQASPTPMATARASWSQ